MNSNYSELTIFMIAYHSSYEVEKMIKKINPLVKILIIENSNLIKTKNYYEKLYKNVNVVLCKKNLGVTGGMNLAFKLIKTKYAIYMDMDVKFSNSTIDNFLLHASKLRNFSFLVPNLYKKSYPNRFYIKKDFNTKYSTMKIAHFHFVLFNMAAVKDIGPYDENIFFYYDETDYCLRALKQNYNIYLIKKLKVRHLEGKSYKSNIQDKLEYIRQWHMSWGKFYFHKKHFGYINALYNTIGDLIFNFLKIIPMFFLDKHKFQIYLNRTSGLINSIIGRKSWKRAKI